MRMEVWVVLLVVAIGNVQGVGPLPCGRGDALQVILGNSSCSSHFVANEVQGPAGSAGPTLRRNKPPASFRGRPLRPRMTSHLQCWPRGDARTHRRRARARALLPIHRGGGGEKPLEKEHHQEATQSQTHRLVHRMILVKSVRNEMQHRHSEHQPRNKADSCL